MQKLKARLLSGVANSTSAKFPIIVGTIHAAKGMEFKGTVVIFDDFSEKAIPVPGERLTRGAVELLNLLYVGITRAQEALRFAPMMWAFMK